MAVFVVVFNFNMDIPQIALREEFLQVFLISQRKLFPLVFETKKL